MPEKIYAQSESTGRCGRINGSTHGVVKKTASENQKVLAIGEIGLDYHYPEPAKEIQQQWFRRQLALAADIKNR